MRKFSRNRIAMLKLHSIALFFIVVFMTASQNLLAQSQCSGSPSYTVNLSTNAASSWTSTNITRAGTCCGGGSGNSNCVEFIVTLNPNAEAFVLEITSGATPPGSLSYTVNCGPPTPIGGKFCVSGVGPHYVSFCKSGGNDNVYKITSIPRPMVSANFTTRVGCDSRLVATGFQESTIQWRALDPTYQSLLTCTSSCDSTMVTSPMNPPSYIDFEVGGTPKDACSGIFSKDTVRVAFVAGMSVNIDPSSAVLCKGESTKTLTAVVTGGNPPYAYQWSNGATTQSITVGAGNYTVNVSDATSCPLYMASRTISIDNDNTVNAGADAVVCSHLFPISLNGTSTQSAQWIGGEGTFTPNRNTLNASYTPSANELTMGSVSLILKGNACSHCPSISDTVVYQLRPSPATAISGETSVCGNLNQEENYSVILNAGNTYNWNVVGGNIVSNNNNSIRVRWTSYGTHSISVTETPANSCAVTKTINVGVSQKPSTGNISH